MRVESDAVWRSKVGELDRSIRGFDLFEPEVVRVRATSAHNREVHRLVESVVTEVVLKTHLPCDSVEFVNHLTL
jgi:hypothetical protein